ncbi:MAG: hypothetical protein A2Y38_07495 [Spirochaetes bacterium GWB1_59_5]|nr:MAG: hypothetical protein A2Y38_07495 [Spirochaetes bacterium GWB1_59_5]
MKGVTSKDQSVPRSQERGIRTAYIVGKVDPDELERGLEGNYQDPGIEGQSTERTEIELAIRSAIYQMKGNREEQFYLVYEPSGELHVVPMDHSLSGSFNVVVKEWLSKWGMPSSLGSFATRSFTEVLKTAARSIPGVGPIFDVASRFLTRGNPVEGFKQSAFVGKRCGLSFDASGGLVLSQLYEGETDPPLPSQHEQNDSRSK